MALAKDPASSGGRARAVDKGDAGDIIYASNFGQNYYDGWRSSHFGHFQPGIPLGLAAYPTHSSKLALQLSTEMKDYDPSSVGGQCTSFRTLSLFTRRRYLSYSAFMALGVGGFDRSWGEFGLYLDIQKADNSSRAFPRLAIQANSAPIYSKVRILDNAAANIAIPGANHLWPGDNENKQGFGYLRLTWDFQANSGLGGYHEAQVQNQVFDLTGLGGGSAAVSPPQTDVGTGEGNIAEYNGGLNLGVFVARSTEATSGNYPATLAVDSIVVSNHD